MTVISDRSNSQVTVTGYSDRWQWQVTVTGESDRLQWQVAGDSDRDNDSFVLQGVKCYKVLNIKSTNYYKLPNRKKS